MEAEKVSPVEDGPIKPDFTSSRWGHYEFISDDYHSKAHLNKLFLEEQKLAKKSLKSYKRNTIKDSKYFSQMKQYPKTNIELFNSKKPDRCFQTSIPNAVSLKKFTKSLGHLYK